MTMTTSSINTILAANPGMDVHTASRLADDADADALAAELTASDGFVRLTSEQHRAAFRGPVVETYEVGALVIADDSCTAGKVVHINAKGAWLVYADFKDSGPLGPYTLDTLRPWPLEQPAASPEGVLVVR